MKPDPYRKLKNAFGRFATGVAVAACRDAAGAPVALTVNSFASVSLEPPLVLWCIEKRASTFDVFTAADSYAVSVLRADMRAMSDRFASRSPAPLAGGESEVWVTGAPLLRPRLAGFDCRIAARHDAGDHVILVGRVLKFDSADGAPLTYFASRYGRLGRPDK